VMRISAKFIAATVALLFIPALIAQPAKAVVVQAGDVGASGTTQIQGLIDGVAIPGLTGSLFLEYDGLSNGGLTWNFDYTVTNTSSGGITSRISSFGLNTTPNTVSAASTGLYGFAQIPSNGYPGFLPATVEMCFGSSASTCTGGNGLTTGQSASGEFTLTFANALSSISLDTAFFRFQSINGNGFDGASGAGFNGPSITPFIVTTTPLPGAVWLFGSVVAGAGAIAQYRKRRKAKQLAVV